MSEVSRYRQYQGAAAIMVKVIAAAPFLWAILNIFDILRDYFGIFIYPTAFTSLFLTFILVLLFLKVPATKKAPRDRLPWYDLLLIATSLVGTLYIFFRAEELYELVTKLYATPMETALGVITLITLFEALRRTIGWPVLILAILFTIYARFAYFLPGLWGSLENPASRLVTYMYLFDSGIFGFVLEIAATIIVVFIAFGSFLNEVGGGEFFANIGLAAVGHTRGGPAKVAVVSSALFGTISGSPLANIGVAGTITIPLMKKCGYKPHFAAAVESIASTGGTIMPPVMGAVAFIMADFTGLGYSAITIAAILPAVLYYACLFFQLDFEAAKTKLAGLPREQLPSFTKTLRNGWQFILPLLLLVGLVMLLQYDPIESAIYALVLLVIVSLFKKETMLTPRRIFNALVDSGNSMILVAPVCALVGVIVGAVTLTNLGINLAAILVNLAGGSIFLLAILSGVAIYVMGMGIGMTVIYILLAIIVAPAMVQMGVPVLVAHMFIFYFGTSMFFTPPNSPAVFIAAGIADASMFKTAFQAMRLGIVCYLIPFVFLYRPALLLMGNAAEIIEAFITSVIGALFLAAGLEGYLLREATWWQRVLFAAGGLALFVPGWINDLVGVVILLIPTLWQFRMRKAARSLPPNRNQ